MKQLKKLCIVFAFCLILLPLSGCIPPWFSNEMPDSFLGSIWESEDGCVRFEVGFEPFDDWYWLGTVKKEGIQIEMVFIMYVTGGLEAVSPNK